MNIRISPFAFLGNKMKTKKTYLLSYDHGGFILWGPHFLSSMETAQKWLEEYPKFKVGLDNETYAYDKYAKDNPEIISEIRNMMEKYGERFDIGSSTYGQPLSCFISEESNVRQITYAIETNLNHFGTRPYVFVISEHALHSQIPQLVRMAGYRMAIMRTHFQMYGYNPTYHSAFGSWIGEDGTEIDCIPTYDGQGAHFGIATMDNYIMTRWPDWKHSIDDFREKFEDIEPLLATRYDDAVLHREEFTTLVESRDDLEWVTLRDLEKIYEACEKDLYRPSAAEFKTRMPWGYCGNRMLIGSRQCESEIILTERLLAMCLLTGRKIDESGLKSAWKDLLIAQHHDIQICGLQTLFDSYKESFSSKVEKLRKEAIMELSRDFESLDGTEIAVFNCSEKEVTQMISQTIRGCSFTEGNALSLKFGDEVIQSEYEIIESQKGILKSINVRFKVTLPAFTARKYRITEEKVKEETEKCRKISEDEYELDTEFYSFLLGKGGIKKITDRLTGRILSESAGEGRLFSGIIEGRNEDSTGNWTVRKKKITITATFSGSIGCIPCRFRMEFRKGDPYIYCSSVFDHNGETIGTSGKFEKFMDNTNGFVHEDKLRFVLGVDFPINAKGYRDRPFLISETDERYIEGNYWTAISDGSKTLAVLNKGDMCLVKEEGLCSIPLAYANTYEWGERYLYGTYSHEFAFALISGEMDVLKTHRDAVNYTYPLVSFQIMNRHYGVEEKKYLSLESSSNVFLSAMYPDKERSILRFYDATGVEGKIDFNELNVEKVDLLLTPKEIISGCVLKTSPHEVVSVRL